MQAFHIDKHSRKIVGIIEPISLDGETFYEITRPQEDKVFITGNKRHAPGLAKGTHKRSIWEGSLRLYLKAKSEGILERFLMGAIC